MSTYEDKKANPTLDTTPEATADLPGLAQKNVDSGIFTPANSGGSNLNVDSVTYEPATWIRIGNRVFVSGALVVTATATGEVKLYLTLPVPSTITDQYSVGGTASHTRGNGTQSYALIARGDTVNNAVFLQGGS